MVFLRVVVLHRFYCTFVLIANFIFLTYFNFTVLVFLTLGALIYKSKVEPMTCVVVAVSVLNLVKGRHFWGPSGGWLSIYGSK